MVKPFNRIAATTEGYRGKKALLEERVIEGLEIPSFTGTDLQLTPESAQTQLLTNANLGQYSRIFLPDATLLNNNWQITIINTANVNVSIYYYTTNTSSTLIKDLQKGGMVTFILLDNSTSQGVWTTFRTGDQSSAENADQYKTSVYDSYIFSYNNFIHSEDSDESDESDEYSSTKAKISLSSILAETPIKSIYVKPTEKFVGSTSLTLSIGTLDDEDKFISNFDLTGDVSNTNFTRDLFDEILSTATDTNLILTINGTNLTTLTSGILEIVVEKVRLVDPTILKNSIIQTQVPIGTIFNYAFYTEPPAGYIRLNGTEVPNARNTIPEFVKLLEDSDSSAIGQKLVIGLQEWKSINNTYGSCGKFTWNGTSLKFPSINCFIEGLTDLNRLATLVQAGLPNINHYHLFGYNTGNNNGSFSAVRNDMTANMPASGGLRGWNGSGGGGTYQGDYDTFTGNMITTLPLEDYRATKGPFSKIYGKSNTVQPQSIKYPYIISVYNKFVDESTLNAQALISSTVEKANTTLDNISSISTNFSSSLNSANIHVVVESYHNGTNWYRVWNDGWCEQGGLTSQANETITLLKQMADTNGTILVTPKNTSAPSSTAGNPCAGFLNTQQIFVSSAQGNLQAYWEVKGYIAQ